MKQLITRFKFYVKSYRFENATNRVIIGIGKIANRRNKMRM